MSSHKREDTGEEQEKKVYPRETSHCMPVQPCGRRLREHPSQQVGRRQREKQTKVPFPGGQSSAEAKVFGHFFDSFLSFGL